MNFAKVRSAPAIGAMVAGAVGLALLLCGAAANGSDTAQTTDQRRVIVAVLPYGVPVEAIGAVEGISPGVMSAGIGSPPPAQSFLDIGQGNRVNERLYDSELPPVYVHEGQLRPGLWEEIVRRADDAPADLIPGLLASAIEATGLSATSERTDGLAPLIAIDRGGEIAEESPGGCIADCPGMRVIRAGFLELDDLVASLGPDELLIAFAAGSRSEQPLWPTGIAGAGFDGNLTSDSTRTDGVILATDIAPTVLEWLGIDVPDEVNGSAIRAEGEPDATEVADLQDRLKDRPSRDTAGLLPLLCWLALATAIALLFRGRTARVAMAVFGLACVWAPLLLLVAAAINADELTAALMLGIGAVVIAGLTYRFVPGLAGLALACAVTVAAHAADVVAGSPYTALSVLGPNPGGGVRFFGIGNELEAILTTLTLVGSGAWLATRSGIEPRRAAGWFLAIAAIAALAFAPGRFGADVGAAIVLGAGGATAAVLALGIERRKAIALVAGGAVAGLGVLLLIDVALGGAHLSRTVLGAGEAGDIVDVLDRRVSLMVGTFTDPVYPELLVAAVLLFAVGFARRRALLDWFGDAWPARCGFLGAVAGLLLGTIANDSGSVLLVLGSIYLGASAACVWGMDLAKRAE